MNQNEEPSLSLENIQRRLECFLANWSRKKQQRLTELALLYRIDGDKGHREEIAEAIIEILLFDPEDMKTEPL